MAGDLTVTGAALLADGNLVVIRLATSAGTSLSGPVVDRTGGADWAQFLRSDLLVEQVVSGLADQMRAMVAAEPEKFRLEVSPSGSWMWPIGPAVAVSGVIERKDACLTTDASVTLSVSVDFEPQPAQGTALAKMRISWDVSGWDSAVCSLQTFLAGMGVVHIPFVGPILAGLGSALGWSSHLAVPMLFEAEAAKKVKSAEPQDDDTRKVAEGDDFVEWQRTLSLRPRSRAVPLTVQSANVDFEGLTSRGSLRVAQSLRELMGFISSPTWHTSANCRTRQVTQDYYPASVTLQHTTPVPLRLLPPLVQTDPNDAWTPRIVETPTGVEITVPGSTRVGTHLALWVHTTSGLRWIDLGTVPAKPPTLTPVEIAAALADCFVLQEPNFGKRYEWQYDPPPDEYGLKHVREWSFAGQGLGSSSAIDLVAVGLNGRERALGRVEAVDGHFSFQVLTAADEELELRTDRVGHSGLLMGQRWITPWARVPIASGPASVTVSDGLIEVQAHNDEKLLADFTGRILTAYDAPAEKRPPSDDGKRSLSLFRTHRAGPTTVAAVDGDDLIIGRAGPLRTIGNLNPPQ
ncbi:hypothetical protein GCM10023237_00120 [Streptomyces coeruleoprunus]|uniref:hypothetical protein n=1 Tax=Streptomyces coeruleoprunus TaxID=285563 RepID=UPI0031E683C0